MRAGYEQAVWTYHPRKVAVPDTAPIALPRCHALDNGVNVPLRPLQWSQWHIHSVVLKPYARRPVLVR
jgi:hypothetical protein